ncbi:hypothetical protein I3760_13G039000 [Carya illinoinensis]|uniref:Pentatricopeptide repeat-containing protein n=1 Tax=Carya illinoinensis TaxID=32201 RepID=A0A8T1NPB9_CARIL|nr:pentatricopeptide repeat-containing protein At4g18975, chloroplastic [Carya illinoinensis]KAG2672403.1 hypothetical protein I3760_13G039000 [Carya illinoinensis]KAG6630727.1 hypothetical protein CIPAW_13G039600 [Carya illinoinensis]KAG6680401.1 hypothetical protein I3842_13G039900 [Carya illinoinensis]
MFRSPTMSFLVRRLTQLGEVRVRYFNSSNYSNMSFPSQKSHLRPTTTTETSFQDECNGQPMRPEKNAGGVERRIGENVSRKDKVNFLVNTLLDIKDSKEAVYGALDAWVAWEQNFPIVSIKRALLALEKEQQWHRVVQVIKWMLSKGQGTTMGTYGQLIRALDMDHRAEEAHKVWERKIGMDLHSVPWQLCRQMISIYYRNNMLKSLVKLFKDLEAFDRKPPEKSIVQRVADAYEMLGLLEEKERVLEKYNDLFTGNESPVKHKKAPSKRKKK